MQVRSLIPSTPAAARRPAAAVPSTRPALATRAHSQQQHDDGCEASTSSPSFAARRLVLVGGALAAFGAPAWASPRAARADEQDPAVAVLDAPAAAPSAPQQPSYAGKLKELYDPTLAYKFEYPVETVSGLPLKMVTTREPEKYSSAAPLSADARQRIVAELLDFSNFVTISMTVGPASGVLKDQQPAQYKPYDVALTVLVDRSTSRLTSGQRTALNDVERADVEVRDGVQYYVYEHVSQGSPTIQETRKKETYRHALAVTAVRPDSQGNPYLYTLNLSCRQELWNDISPLFKEAVRSFRLVPTTSQYIAPDVNPWQFW